MHTLMHTHTQVFNNHPNLIHITFTEAQHKHHSTTTSTIASRRTQWSVRTVPTWRTLPHLISSHHVPGACPHSHHQRTIPHLISHIRTRWSARTVPTRGTHQVTRQHLKSIHKPSKQANHTSPHTNKSIPQFTHAKTIHTATIGSFHNIMPSFSIISICVHHPNTTISSHENHTKRSITHFKSVDCQGRAVD